MARPLEKNQQIESLRSEIQLLAKSHDEAVRTSFDGVQFNCFSKVWKLNLNKNCYLERLYSTNFEYKELVMILLVLGDVAETRSAIATSNVVNTISKGDLGELTVKGVKEAVALSRSKNSSDVGIRKLKTFILALGNRYPEYADLVAEIRSYKVRQSMPSIYDAEKGALTEYEHASLKNRIDEFSQQVFVDFASGDFSYGLLCRFRQLIIMRLLTITVRRPVQLSMLKWGDIRADRTSIKNEFSILMPCAKKFTVGGFRASFEDVPIPLDEEFSNELIAFKHFAFERLSKVMEEKLPDFCLTDFERMFDYFPIVPLVGIFKVDISESDLIPETMDQLKQLLGPTSSAFHIGCSGSVTGTFDMLDSIDSDRSVNVNRTLGCQRLRHTVGSRMAAKGYDNLTISTSLGNTPKAAKYYIDLLPESRNEIDNKVTGLQHLAKRFSGQLVSSVEPDRAIYNDVGNICGKGEVVNTCEACIQARPISCYGCDNFRPLIGADHNSSLELVIAYLKKWQDLGADDSTLAPIKNKIKNIESTILACEAASKNLVEGSD
ncbi:MAG: hypothetical protein AAF431_02435 [Pseudomonadota bacterium]